MDIIGRLICFRRIGTALSRKEKTFFDSAMALHQNRISFVRGERLIDSTSMDDLWKLPGFSDNANGFPRKEKLLFDRAMALRQNKISFGRKAVELASSSMDLFLKLQTFTHNVNAFPRRGKALLGRAMALCQNRICSETPRSLGFLCVLCVSVVYVFGFRASRIASATSIGTYRSSRWLT